MKKIDFPPFSVFFFGQRTENQKPTFLFWLGHSEKVRDLGFHMRQSASKSARTASEEKLLKLGSPFGQPLGDGPKSSDFGCGLVHVRASPTGDFECPF